MCGRDWSSDVCSSDLGETDREVGGETDREVGGETDREVGGEAGRQAGDRQLMSSGFSLH